MLSSFFERIHILQNLYLKNKCFLKRKTYSMDGEDIEISKYFKNKNNGFYVDVGSYHPIHRNNTMLLHKKGWEGINIDISSFSIKLFNYLRPRDTNLNLAISEHEGNVEMYFQKKLSQLSTTNKFIAEKNFQGKIKTKKIQSETLTTILDRSKYKNKKIDLLDIDVEGADLKVLKSLSFEKFQPELICVEVHDKNLKESETFKLLNNLDYELIWSGVFSHIFKSKH